MKNEEGWRICHRLEKSEVKMTVCSMVSHIRPWGKKNTTINGKPGEIQVKSEVQFRGLCQCSQLSFDKCTTVMLRFQSWRNWMESIQELYFLATFLKLFQKINFYITSVITSCVMKHDSDLVSPLPQFSFSLLAFTMSEAWFSILRLSGEDLHP